MIEAEAIVTAVDGDTVILSTRRQSTCGGCQAKNGCGTSLLAEWFSRRQPSFRLPNGVAARVGDTVILGIREDGLRRGSLWLYALPLSGLLLGAVAGERLFAAAGMNAELGAVLSGLLGVTAALWLVNRVYRRRQFGSDSEVRLLRVQHQQYFAVPVRSPAERQMNAGTRREGK